MLSARLNNDDNDESSYTVQVLELSMIMIVLAIVNLIFLSKFSRLYKTENFSIDFLKHCPPSEFIDAEVKQWINK